MAVPVVEQHRIDIVRYRLVSAQFRSKVFTDTARVAGGKLVSLVVVLVIKCAWWKKRNNNRKS